MNATAFMATLSTAGRSEDLTPKPPRPSPTLVVEQWDGRQWVARKLVWNGSSYVPESA